MDKDLPCVLGGEPEVSTKTQGRAEVQLDGQKSNEIINEDSLRIKKTTGVTVNGV